MTDNFSSTSLNESLHLITEQLQLELNEAIERAESIYIVVAFIQPSGVTLILDALQRAAKRGADIHILIGDYLYITHPEAIELLLQHVKEANIRLFVSDGRSFHPKAYLFRMRDRSHSIIGSSNLSHTALTTAVEWNVRAQLHVDAPFFERAVEQFFQLFFHPSTIPMNTYTLQQYEERYDEAKTQYGWLPLETFDARHTSDDIVLERAETTYPLLPRPAQQLALDALETMVAEQYDKAMIVMATGLGKTYVSAFFARSFQRVLFIAHREQLLHQARTSFQHVFPNDTCSTYNGTTKEKEGRFVFASIFTLAAKHHIEQFERQAFDLIIIDEFHHATATTYERVLAYFRPKFLLGMTATPDRLDNKDVYALCDGNVAISIHFIDAIRNGWLAPFHYYGVRDPIEYDAIPWRHAHYDEERLLQAQFNTTYAEAAFKQWQRYRQTRTIAFCSSVRQATFIGQYFEERGVRAVTLHGEHPVTMRRETIEALQNGEIDMIFTVDLFNEGVDIPLVDTLLFLRPTESLAIFTQQIGRGLRLADGKSHCVIIDLIGNYRNADRKLAVFTDGQTIPTSYDAAAFQLPDECHIQFDLDVIDLLDVMKRKRSPRKQLATEAFERLTAELGRFPTFVEFHLQTDASPIIREQFGTYPHFLAYAHALTEEERAILQTYEAWLREVTTTRMSKSYKMVVLLAMLQRGPHDWFQPITAEAIAPFFHHYIVSVTYRRKSEFSTKVGEQLLHYNERRMAEHIRTMPMQMWARSPFGQLEGEQFSFRLHVAERERHTLFSWTKQICEYRLQTYFERRGNI